MKTIEIHGQTNISKIAVGESLDNLGKYLADNKAIIVTDSNVKRLYAWRFPTCPVIEIGLGEKIKTLDTVAYIFKKLVEAEIDRSWCIVGVGGGIVCDITGFAASTYMRGVRFGFVPTTLLAQVDAGVGGKNGINFLGFKNMVGVFNQPDFVLCDPAVLKTLPGKELANGFAEIIKHAAIGDSELFAFLEENYSAALLLDEKIIEKLVFDSVSLKSAIVNRDEKEKGERRKLNFGHTIGHALEKVQHIPHGRAVSIGMALAAEISVKRGLLEAEQARRLSQLLDKVGLPTWISGSRAKVIAALGKDKKREGAGIHFVLLKAIGEAVIVELPFAELEEMIHVVC